MASLVTRAFACYSKWRWCQSITLLRACVPGGEGPQVGKVTRLGGVKKYLFFACNLTTPSSRGALSQDYWMVAKHVNRENAGKPRVLAINVLLLLLQPLVLWLSIVTFNNDAKPLPKWILRKYDVSQIRPRLGGLPHLPCNFSIRLEHPNSRRTLA